MRNLLHGATLLAAIALFAACGTGASDSSESTGAAESKTNNASAQSTQPKANPWEGVEKFVAVMIPTEGNNVRGTVVFTKTSDGQVKIVADITGLEPNSTHGIHIHQFGDIRKNDGTSAGGHYSPRGHEHGLPDEPASSRHAGDLGNLTADEDGNAHYELTVDNISLLGSEAPILGRGMIIHAKPDDGGQPTGNAGARMAMGVIGVANPDV